MRLPAYSKMVQKKTIHIEIHREGKRMTKPIGHSVNNYQTWVKVTGVPYIDLVYKFQIL